VRPPAPPPTLSRSGIAALLIAAAFYAGTVAADQGAAAVPAMLAPLGALVLLLPDGAGRLQFASRRRRALRSAILLLAFLPGWVAARLHTVADPVPGLLRLWRGHRFEAGATPVGVRGRLLDEQALPDGRSALLLRLERYRLPGPPALEGAARAPVLLRLTVPILADEGPPLRRPGDLVEVVARLSEPRTFRNPGAFDYAAYLRARGIELIGTIKSPRLITVVARGERSWSGLLPTFRRSIGASLVRTAGPGGEGTASILAALLLGEREDLPDDLERALKRAGVYHIIALSGLNVAVIALLVSALLRLAKVPPKGRRIGGALAVIGYWLVARGSGSIARAALMAVLCLAGGVLERRVSPLGAIAVTGVLILAREPAWARDAGFQLSFAATISLVLLAMEGTGGRLERAVRPRRAVSSILLPLRVSAAALAGTTLLTAHHFQTMTPVALVANLYAVPLANLLLILALSVALCGPWAPILARVLVVPAGWLVKVLGRLSEAISSPSWCSFHVLPPGPAPVLWGSVLVLVAGARRGRGGGRAAGLALAALILWAAVHGPPGGAPGVLEITVLDVGQGDAILVRFPSGVTMLIDAGGFARSGFDVGERVVGPALRTLGDLKVDILAITHAHRDHLGGAEAILRDFSPGALWLGRMPEDDPAVRALVDRALRMHVPAVLPRRGARLGIGGTRVEVLNPGSGVSATGGAVNDDSLVLRIVFEDRAALLTGDLEARLESILVGEGRALSADLLKVGHHGSRTSTSPPFLARVQPSFGAISVGRTNPWGHPDREVLRRLAGARVRVYRTDRAGAVRFRTDGSNPWSVEVLVPQDAPGTASRSEALDRDRDEAEDQDDQGQEGDRPPPRTQGFALVEEGRVARTQEGEDDAEGHEVVPAGQEPPDDQDRTAVARHRPVYGAREGVQHVATVELADRQQIEGRREEADPAGHADRMETDRGGGISGEDETLEEIEEEAAPQADLVGVRRLPGHDGARQSVDDDRECDDEPGDRSGHPDVEESAAMGDRRTDPDHGAEGSEEMRSGKEEGERRVDPVQPAGDIVSHLVCPEDEDETQRVWDPQSPVGRGQEDVPHRRPGEIAEGHQRPGDQSGDDGQQKAGQVDGGRQRTPSGRRGRRGRRPALEIGRRLGRRDDRFEFHDGAHSTFRSPGRVGGRSRGTVRAADSRCSTGDF